MNRHAADIHEDTSHLDDELREPSRSGRITMSSDSWNQNHTLHQHRLQK